MALSSLSFSQDTRDGIFCHFIRLSVFYSIRSQNDSLGFFCLVLLSTFLCIDDDAHIFCVEKILFHFRFFMSNLCSKRR